MLYQIYETQRALMAPFSEFASASAKLYNHPLSPFTHTPMAQRVAAGFDLIHRLAKDYEKPEFGIRTVPVDGVDVAVQEQYPIVLPFCRLIRFKRYSDDPVVLEKMKSQPVVLVVAPLSGHHSTLLRDTVRQLLRDHKVYITDWVDARQVPAEAGPFHLNDYVSYVQDFIRHLGPEVNVISVCQPTVPVLAAVSLLATKGEFTPRTLTMMGGPIDARRSPTAVNNLAMNKSFEWFENNVIYRVPPNFAGAGRRVYPGFLQHTGFVAMNPDRHLSAHYDYFQDLIRGDDDSTDAHRQFYDEYNAVLDMPAEYYLETIKTVFQDFALVNGTWQADDGTYVRPQDITTSALLTVEGELDDISGAGQTRAAHDLCSGVPKSRQFHYDVAGAGHYGIFSGRRWREKVYPEIKAFILTFNSPEGRLDHTPTPDELSGDYEIDRIAVDAPAAVAAEAPARKITVRKATPVKTAKTASKPTAPVAAEAPVAAAAPARTRSPRAAATAPAPAANRPTARATRKPRG
ncbi:polyhydroxyalkanoate depolymerase [Aquabacterium sp. OR-4]|uniref:polyhydroxyalkanoate depolymerase n=1 Tax=Aquabacterium sp. OR-4 TaxID=2978127 RepID=UPI0021B33D8A|nr:polyhydroxyalkanoate depolymerase [Aquabacterium sp. OR-4]MDT7836110.1 polyhydroxyalkanoate depolymerase [Aquabacterium sp. OR-4]